MNLTLIHSVRRIAGFFACLAVLAMPLNAATGGLKQLKIRVSEDRRTVEVGVPRGYGEVTLQKFTRETGWRKFASKTAPRPGTLHFALPPNGRNIRWRAIGRFSPAAISKSKFPAGFYRGENLFPSRESSSNRFWYNRSEAGILAPDNSVDSGGDQPADPVEADIWKIEDNIVYFFNQLRGLQILDVSSPEDPRLIASLRMPAVGEDLYLLPGSGPNRSLVLLSRAVTPDHSPLTRIHLVDVSASGIQITHQQDVRGYLADSRMMGDRLVLATTEGVSWNERGEVSRCLVSEWSLTPGAAPLLVTQSRIQGQNPLISAGRDWLAVAVTPNGAWGNTDITVFGRSSHSGSLLRMTPTPVRTAGVVADKFKIQWSDNILTTISEKNNHLNNWSPVTVLETFRVWGPDVIRPAVVEPSGPLATLRLADGESLFATRFAGNKAYIVTFLQTDPLWVVDLSDPIKPVVAGHLEVPGWSTYLEPIGDMLLSVGWESDTVAASLFNVADPANPTLVRRINLGASGTYSEALWDEQALKVIPEAGLVMVPLSSYTGNGLATRSLVQLLDLDVATPMLAARGVIPHDFDARRAAVVGSSVVSISQRVMVTADITDRDLPSISSEVTLAWPVDRIVEAPNHLLQIESGNFYDSSSRATLRVSPLSNSEVILSETDLGDGRILAADLRGGQLFVLRQPGIRYGYYPRPGRISGWAPARIVLDVYDASALPTLTLLGSCKPNLGSDQTTVTSGLLWPRETRPAVVLQSDPWTWFGPWLPVMPLATAKTASISIADALPPPISPPFQPLPPTPAPRLLVFDVARPTAPRGGAVVPIGDPGTLVTGPSRAADGLVVVGTSDSRVEATGLRLPPSRALPSVRVIEVPSSGIPVVRPAIDLPGVLFEVTDLDRDGFLAFTRRDSLVTKQSHASGALSTQIEASACDGHDAFLVAGIRADAYSPATASGRRLFVAGSDRVASFLLSDEGIFQPGPAFRLNWQPSALRMCGSMLVGSQWQRLFLWDTSSPTPSIHQVPGWWFDPDSMVIDSSGDLRIPLGDFGVETISTLPN